jgi:putative endonuclease
MSMKFYYVYILSNKRNGTLYIGMTNDLGRRMREHKLRLNSGFASRYRLTRLVFFETLGDAYSAILREKQLKGWLRSRKIALIETENSEWSDLSRGWGE